MTYAYQGYPATLTSNPAYEAGRCTMAQESNTSAGAYFFVLLLFLNNFELSSESKGKHPVSNQALDPMTMDHHLDSFLVLVTLDHLLSPPLDLMILDLHRAFPLALVIWDHHHLAHRLDLMITDLHRLAPHLDLVKMGHFLVLPLDPVIMDQQLALVTMEHHLDLVIMDQRQMAPLWI